MFNLKFLLIQHQHQKVQKDRNINNLTLLRKVQYMTGKNPYRMRKKKGKINVCHHFNIWTK